MRASFKSVGTLNMVYMRQAIRDGIKILGLRWISLCLHVCLFIKRFREVFYKPYVLRLNYTFEQNLRF